MEKEIIRVKLKTISPVHIGSSEVYDPTGFVVDTDNKILTSFDPTDFISSLTDTEKSELSDICKKGSIKSIIELYRFMNGRKIFGNQVVLPEDFTNHYRTILGLTGSDRDIIQNLNQFVIERTSFHKNNHRPYIPGSTIKGSLRTAYLNLIAKELDYPVNFKPSNIFGNKWNFRKAEVLETRLISKNKKNLEHFRKSIDEDPFRLIKVSDFHPIEESMTKIFYCINKKKKEDKEARELYQIIEGIKPGTEFIGTITIEQPVNNRYVKNTISRKKLLNSVKYFFSKLLEEEKEVLNRYNTVFTPPEKNLPIKFGKHSGAEGVTIEGYREIRIKLKKGFKTLPYSTTCWFASEYKNPSPTHSLYPMGWSEFETLSESKFKELSDIQKDVEELYEKEISYKRNQIEVEIQKEIEKEQQKIEDQKKLEEEKKQKEEEIKAIKDLPQGEKELALLSTEDITEQKVNEIYKDLDSMPEEYKIKIADKIKKFFIKNNKWGNPKKLSKKQGAKVKKLKGLLNE